MSSGCRILDSSVPRGHPPLQLFNPVIMKQLYRSKTDKVIAGIFGGIAETYSIDPSLLRLALVFLGVATGVVPLVVTYAVGWIIISMWMLVLIIGEDGIDRLRRSVYVCRSRYSNLSHSVQGCSRGLTASASIAAALPAKPQNPVRPPIASAC